MSTLLNIPVNNIEENPVALRAVNKKSPEYVELVDSVKRDGVLLSISVVPQYDATGRQPKFNSKNEQMYRLVDGLHRWNAARDAGLENIPSQVFNKSEAEIHVAQLVANSHKIETKRVEYAKHLNRILATDPMMTVIQLSAKISKSPAWIAEQLSLLKLDPAIGKLVDEGKLPASNAVELSKLSVEDQKTFLSDAMNEINSVFAPKVKARIKELREAARAGRDPNAPKDFIPVAHARPFKYVKEALDDPSTLTEWVERQAPASTREVVTAVLKWACHMDDESIDKAKAASEARKAAEAVEKEKRKQDREGQKAREKAVLAAHASELETATA